MSSKLGKTSSLVDNIFRYLFTLHRRQSLAKIEFILRFLSYNIGCIINSPQVIEVQIAFISDYFSTGNDENFCSLWCQNMIVMVSKQQKIGLKYCVCEINVKMNTITYRNDIVISFGTLRETKKYPR